MSIPRPGIEYNNTMLIQSELGVIKRFISPGSMVNYYGLAPNVEQSGDYMKYGTYTSIAKDSCAGHSYSSSAFLHTKLVPEDIP